MFPGEFYTFNTHYCFYMNLSLCSYTLGKDPGDHILQGLVKVTGNRQRQNIHVCHVVPASSYPAFLEEVLRTDDSWDDVFYLRL